jgi:hypothetical protein
VSIERALIAQAQPLIVAARAKALIRKEVAKGCQPAISPVPVSLEPTFQSLWDSKNFLSDRNRPSWKMEAPLGEKEREAVKWG